MLNFNNFPYSKVTMPTDADEKKSLMDSLTAKFITELNESEKCQEYFKGFNAESVQNFVKEYASYKAKFIESFNYYMKLYNEDKNENFLQYAREALNALLQKKLFNLQLQWRANQIKIDEIRTSYDFEFWAESIEYCPFIPAINTLEFETMKKYLLQNNFKNIQQTEDWQDYDRLMEKDDEDDYENMPEWYEFYDAMFGTGKLLLLPNIRGEKESFYIRKNREAEVKKEEEEKKDTPPPEPYIPSLYAYFNSILEFSEKYEDDPYFKELFKLWYRNYHPEYEDNEYNRDDVDEAIDVLEKADRTIVLPPNMTWHKAIVLAADQYTTIKTIEAMESVYEEYRTLADLGISKHYTPDEDATFNKEYFSNLWAEKVLKGRELNGEPRDFNF